MASDHVIVNRATWDEDAPNWVERGRLAWSADEPTWGRGNPESELHLLDGIAGLDAVELGCGTGYISAWLARAGARPVGLDNSSAQLATARMFQEEFSVRFPLVHADAEHPPFADVSFDFAISEYGAATFCDPYLWIPEASRMLRVGGRLVFVDGSSLVMLCYPPDDAEAPADTRLHRDYFGMHRVEWTFADGSTEVEFRLGHGDMIRLLRSRGFEIEDLIELQAPATAARLESHIPFEWARRWPSAEVWKARKVR